MFKLVPVLNGAGHLQARSRRYRSFAVLVFLTFAYEVTPCQSQEGSSAPTFADLEARFDEAATRINQPITQLNTSFHEALKRLMASETAAGKLDEALQVKAEIEAFAAGVDFDLKTFTAEPSEHPAIQAMRTKYLAERERLWKLGKKGRDELLKSYQAALASLEQEHTKLGNFDAAISVRNTRDTLSQDPRFHDGVSSAASAPFLARIHFVAKGDVELRLKGSRLPYRNHAPDRDKYIDGTGNDVMLSVGDVIVLSMRATAVYRGFVMTIESEDGKTAVPVKLNDYRYLGEALNGRELNPDVETLKKVSTRPGIGSPDADMSAMWGEKSLSDLSRAGSEWIMCGPGDDWHHYAILLESGMLLAVPD